ncbi:MAG: hypothetical protein ABIP27_22195 [Flavobacterium circumlabens]|uniref:Uncharacterized protein n=1 Tax=Flavobacterium circumlabens TaxID=2133765 RepID=A0A4Y7UHU1_9FLAO|nr:hypothetical protein [Flavobacterium circumlabens]TCN60903.1 hypothetical protein EV142_101482 [Flavobacterium circumlabens]TEB46023.1 hypothetical protein D0809_03245 [Flavobacterium circumlabens]
MKKLKNLNGVEILTANQQKEIKGGIDQYHCYAPISKDQCTAVGGKWNTIQNMCILEIGSELCG